MNRPDKKDFITKSGYVIAMEKYIYHLESHLENCKKSVLQWQKELTQLKKEREENKELLKEAYTDGFNDSIYDFDIENYLD